MPPNSASIVCHRTTSTVIIVSLDAPSERIEHGERILHRIETTHGENGETPVLPVDGAGRDGAIDPVDVGCILDDPPSTPNEPLQRPRHLSV